MNTIRVLVIWKNGYELNNSYYCLVVDSSLSDKFKECHQYYVNGPIFNKEITDFITENIYNKTVENPVSIVRDINKLDLGTVNLVVETGWL